MESWSEPNGQSFFLRPCLNHHSVELVHALPLLPTHGEAREAGGRGGAAGVNVRVRVADGVARVNDGAPCYGIAGCALLADVIVYIRSPSSSACSIIIHW